jgi:16S rRNA processing protein RimM
MSSAIHGSENNHETPRLCAGVFVSPHGVKGLVKLKSLLEIPEDIFTYKPLTDSTGQKSYTLTLEGKAGEDVFIVRMEDVNTREAAEKLKQQRVYVSPELLPALAEEAFYHYQLVGCSVWVNDGLYGVVTGIENYGASDIVCIRKEPEGVEELYAFTDDTFPEIDIENRRITLNPLEEI